MHIAQHGPSELSLQTPAPHPDTAGTISFDYAALDPDIAAEARAAAARIQDRVQKTMSDTGSDLIAIKAKMPHGAFGAWIKAEFQMSGSTAQNYMNATRYLEGKSTNFGILPPSAIYLLASAPPEVAAEVEARVERGSFPKVAEIKERVAAVAKAQQAALVAKSAEQIKKDHENGKRRKAIEKARLEKLDADQKAIEIATNERAQKVAAFLVSHIGEAGVDELEGLMRGTDWYRVEQHFPSKFRGIRTLADLSARIGASCVQPGDAERWVDVTPAADAESALTGT
jgi:predicted NAD-dependent protein-ADP-ribosyltransferase YbiA (DUF1768 family)